MSHMQSIPIDILPKPKQVTPSTSFSISIASKQLFHQFEKEQDVVIKFHEHWSHYLIHLLFQVSSSVVVNSGSSNAIDSIPTLDRYFFSFLHRSQMQDHSQLK